MNRGRQDQPTSDVLVVDARAQFVGYVHWAVARKALKEQRARVWRRSPTVIMLPPGEVTLPSFEVVVEKEKKMNPNGHPHLNPVPTNGGTQTPQGVMNWFQFFQQERELWVQNISATQLSMQFEISPGHIAGVLIPIGSDPICMTNEVPFESIKKSLDFRKFLNRVPSVMKLMTTEQAHEFFAEKAKHLNAYIQDPATGQLVPNIGAAIEYAERERKNLTMRPAGDDTVIAPNGQVYFAPPKSAQELQGMNQEQHMGINPQAAAAAGLQHVPAGYSGPQGFANAPGFIQQAQQQAMAGGPSYGQPGTQPGFSPQAAGFSNVGQMPVMMENLINPRVLNLCQQVSMQIPANMRMPAEQFFREIKQLSSALTFEDLQYVEAHGTYKTVKKWARDLQQTRVAQGQGEGLEDGLEGQLGGP